MSSEIERVKQALQSVPRVWVRTNKMNDRNRIYEIGYTELESAVISDDTIHILDAVADPDEASERQEELQIELSARAAIAAMQPQWREIDENTPRDEDKLYLACRAGAKIPGIVGWDDDEGWFWFNGMFKGPCQPTHWRPLPAPPAAFAETPDV
jgi:hypothetical protein